MMVADLVGAYSVHVGPSAPENLQRVCHLFEAEEVAARVIPTSDDEKAGIGVEPARFGAVFVGNTYGSHFRYDHNCMCILFTHIIIGIKGFFFISYNYIYFHRGYYSFGSTFDCCCHFSKCIIVDDPISGYTYFFAISYNYICLLPLSRVLQCLLQLFLPLVSLQVCLLAAASSASTSSSRTASPFTTGSTFVATPFSTTTPDSLCLNHHWFVCCDSRIVCFFCMVHYLQFYCH